MKPVALALACWLWVAATGPAARADAALVAVATNFAETARALAADFSTSTGHVVTLATGSTGKLQTQIEQGAPFDALLSADDATPERLEAAGLGVAGTRFPYALGRLVVYGADPGRIDGDGPAALRDDAVRHVAIANPRLAPYGAAADTALRRLGLWDVVAPKRVLGQNVGQAYALVVAGAAELGFVARSQVTASDQGDPCVSGSCWSVPPSLHEPIVQEAILLRRGADNAAARAFLAHLRSPAARATIRAAGYEAP